jgi:hypothetical protein
MFERLRTTKNIYLIYLGVFVLALFAFMLTSFLLSRTPNQPSENPPGNISNEVVISSFSPETTKILTPGNRQTFTVSFSEPINRAALQVRLLKSGVVSTQRPQTVPVTLDYADEIQKISIRTNEIIEPYSRYALILTRQSDNKLLYQAIYYSAKEELSKKQLPDQSLRSFLPYETQTYKLSYNDRLDSYVFNLKLNPGSADNYNLQFEKAQQQAETFIKSKGLDPATLDIEWRRS